MTNISTTVVKVGEVTVAMILNGNTAVLSGYDFSRIKIPEQTDLILSFGKKGYDVIHVPSLEDLTNPYKVLSALQDDKDVRVSLDLLGISYDENVMTIPVDIECALKKHKEDIDLIRSTFNDAKGKALERFRKGVAEAGIIEKLTAMLPPYPFIENTARSQKRLIITQTRISNGSGYALTRDDAKKVFDYAISIWSKYPDPKKVRSEERDMGLGTTRRTVVVGSKSVAIDCQTIHRWQVEELGRELGWSFEVKT